MMDTERIIGPLEPCPFCGAPAQIMLEGNKRAEPDMILCGGKDCHLQPMMWLCDFDSDAEAASAWNKRMTTPNTGE
jgi:hypothetical protein